MSLNPAQNFVVQSRAAYAFFERNWNLSKRYWAWELVWVVYNLVNALAVTYIAVSANTVIPGIHITQAQINSAVLFLTIGTAIWTYISVCFDNVTEVVTVEKWEGTIEYTFMAPIQRITQMLGTCAYAILHGLLLTAVQLAVMALFFHIDLSHANYLTTLVLLAVGSVSFIGFGIMAAVLPMLFTERGAQMAYIIRAVLLLLSGVYYPITVLPIWAQPFARISPVTYVLDGIRAGLMRGVPIWHLWGHVLILLVEGAITIPVGLWIFRRAEMYAKRTGKLKRNG
ncbi:MAG: ABC transporter permease [Ktedonobacterales bacterium]|nr:ABC transporter permease [Ktedonobacterales bacterium]